MSKDYSIGRVNYDAGGLPQNANVLEGIKASGLYFDDVFSTDKGEWRVLTTTTSHDATGTYSYSYSLYNPDGNWKSPLGKAENLRRSVYHRDDNSLYFVSGDYPSYTITKMDRETLTETAKSSEPMKEYPQFSYDGIIYSRSRDSEKPSLTVLDGDLKGKTFELDAGDYSYPVSLGDGSLATTFVSRDVQEFVDEEGISHSTSTLKDLGIFKFTTSAKTRIVTSADLGFSASDTWGSIGDPTSYGSGGLYFVVNKSGSSALYHWDGSRTTSVFKAGDGESIRLFALDSSGNVYCHVSKSVRNEQTQLATITTSLYRVGTSAPVYKEEYTGNDAGVESIQRDSSGNIYFAAYKSSGNSTSRALYRCGASQTTATKLHEATDGSWIDLMGYSGYKDGKYVFSLDDQSGNIYFMVSSGDISALYRCGISQNSAVKLYEVTDGSGIRSVGMDDSDNLYFTVEKSTWNPETYVTTFTSSALYRCGPSATSPTPIHSVTDGSFIGVGPSDVFEAGSKGVYFTVLKRKEETERREDGTVVYLDSYYPSYAFCHYNGTNVSTIHTFNNVSSAGSRVDEKHEVLYLYASPMSSDLGSTLLAFDNTDRHNPDKVEEFEIAGRIGSVELYNHIVEPSSNVPSKPTTYTTTPKIEEKYVSQAPASGWTSFPITGIVDANGTPSPAKTLFYVWLNIISPLSVAANLADDEWGPYLLESEKEGELEFDVSKLKNLDGTPVTDFPGGNCIITYSTTFNGEGGFSGTTEQVKVAKSSSSTSNVTSNKGSGGCDAGFGALALAVLAAGVLLKKHSK